MNTSPESTPKIGWYSIGILAAANIIYQLVASSRNANSISQAKPGYLLLAVLSEVFAYLVLVQAFRVFMEKYKIDLSFLQSLGILFAGVGLSKVIPFGEYFLWRQRLKPYKNGVAATAQFTVLFLLWVLCALIGLFLGSEVLAAVFNPSKQVGLLAKSFAVVPIFFTIVIASVIVATRSKFFRAKLGTDTLGPIGIIREVGLGKKELGWLTFGAIFTWLFEASTLYMCLNALGINPPLLVILFGYCFARLFVIVPIFPGGIGEVEAATTLFFVSYGFPAGKVFTATVLFRLLTYWMPIIFGASTYALGKRKNSLQRKTVLAKE
jgi:uncharacterized membrane protein YbhN (UPF0104 family)